NPVVAVALGVTLLGERPGVGAVAGLLLILAGSWLSTGGKLPPGMVRWAPAWFAKGAELGADSQRASRQRGAAQEPLSAE
ncbi:MAG: hypothetical protein JO372_06550, partial [Solirubrobacterales bacterium]|nr:hypothetical protein [Solirubrobacterales bacterium]